MKKHKHNDISHCVEMFEKLSEYIDGEVGLSTCQEIEKHIDACVACQICLATLKQTVKLCKEVKQSPVPADVSKRIQALIKELQENHSNGPPVPKTAKR